MKRTVAALASALALMLVLAPAALAENGVGLAGPTTDKTVTFFCFGVIAFFALLADRDVADPGQAGEAQGAPPHRLQRFS